MKVAFRVAVLGLGLLIGAPGTGQAYPEPAFMLSRMVRTADIIVVGIVKNPFIGSPYLQVENSFGATDPRPGARLTLAPLLAHRESYNSYDGLQTPMPAEGDRLMLFLRRQGGDYQPVDDNYPLLRVGRGPASPHPDARSWLADALVEQLVAQAAPALNDTYGEKHGINDVQSLDAGLVSNLRDLTPTLTRPLLLRRWHSLPASNQAARFWLVTALLNDGEIEGLAEAVRFYLATVPRLNIHPEVSFRMALYDLKLADPANRVVLVRCVAPLMDSANPEINAAALSALRANPSPEAVPLMIRGLSNPDFTARYLAVTGLAEQTKAAPLWSMPDYQKHQAEIDRFWRNWAAAHR